MTGGPTFTYRDPLEMPRRTAAELLGGGEGVWLPNGDAPRRFTRRAPEFIDDPDGTRLFPDGLPDIPVPYPPLFLAGARDVRLVGYRTLLTPDGHFFNDDSVSGELRQRFLAAMEQEDGLLNEETRLRPVPDTPAFRLDPAGRVEYRIEGPVVVLCSTEPSNYGSWLFRTLPKLVTAGQYGLGGARFLVHVPPGPFLDHLALCGVSPRQVIQWDPNRIASIEHALVPCLRNNQAFLDPETAGLYAALRRQHGGASTGRRLYVSRVGHSGRGRSGRVLLNEAELIEHLRARGFDIVAPETLSARDQVAAFSSAGLVVGPSGSGMFNVVFCHPGTGLIDIESEPYWIHAHACLFTSCGLRFGVFCGKVDAGDPAPVHRRWTVNIPALLERIDSFSA